LRSKIDEIEKGLDVLTESEEVREKKREEEF